MLSGKFSFETPCFFQCVHSFAIGGVPSSRTTHSAKTFRRKFDWFTPTIRAFTNLPSSAVFYIFRLALLAVSDVWVGIVSAFAARRKVFAWFDFFTNAAFFVCLVRKSFHMLAHVLGLAFEQLQIAWVVIQFVAVFVVDNFLPVKRPADNKLHNMPMFKHSFVVDSDITVSKWSDIASSVGGPASAATKIRASDGTILSVHLLTDLKLFATNITSKLVHFHGHSSFPLIIGAMA